jgi:O-antigen ligase
MQPTSIRLLLVVAALAGAVGYVGATLWDSLTGSPPGVPVTAPAMLLLLAVGFAVAAHSLRPRLERVPGHRPLDPFKAARTAVLALAGSRAGAAMLGLYAGYAVFLLFDLANPFRRRTLLVAGLAALAAGAMSAAALWLERVCRVEPPDDEASGQAAPAG